MIMGIKTYDCENKNKWLCEQKPMGVRTNLGLWEQIYGCGNKSMVMGTLTYGCGNKSMVVGTLTYGCRNKSMVEGIKIYGCGNKSMVVGTNL
jgi:hypothetical protein